MIVFNVIIMIIAIMIIILIEQDATFTFIDVAPQWQSFNAGDIYIIEIIDSQNQTLQTYMWGCVNSWWFITGNWLDIENGVRYLAEQVYEKSLSSSHLDD